MVKIANYSLEKICIFSTFSPIATSQCNYQFSASSPLFFYLQLAKSVKNKSGKTLCNRIYLFNNYGAINRLCCKLQRIAPFPSCSPVSTLVAFQHFSEYRLTNAFQKMHKKRELSRGRNFATRLSR